MTIPPGSAHADVPLFGPEELEAMRGRLRSLTPRQREVLMLFGEGHRPAEIARRLGVSKQTISFHLTRAKRKLGLESHEDLLVYAVLLRKSADESEPHSTSEPGQSRLPPARDKVSLTKF